MHIIIRLGQMQDIDLERWWRENPVQNVHSFWNHLYFTIRIKWIWAQLVEIFGLS